MKKIFAALLSISMIMSLASCGDNSDTSSVNDGTAEVTTTAETDAASDDSAETTEAETEDSKEKEDEVDINSLVFDFKGLDTEEYMTIFSSKKYHISYTVEGMSQSLYYDNGNMFLTSEYSGIKNDMLFKDGKQYMLSDDMHCVVPEEESYLGITGDMFADFGYLESGEIEHNGTTYKYDEYYQTSTGAKTKFLITPEKKLYGFESSGVFMIVNECSGEFDSETIINIPEGSREVSYEELINSMMTKYFGENMNTENEGEVPVEGEENPDANAENNENAENGENPEAAPENAE